jgi:hypothetical protein
MYLKIKKKPSHVKFFFLLAGLLFLGGLIILFGLSFGTMGVLFIVGIGSIVIGAIIYFRRKRSQLSHIDLK